MSESSNLVDASVRTAMKQVAGLSSGQPGYVRSGTDAVEAEVPRGHSRGSTRSGHGSLRDVLRCQRCDRIGSAACIAAGRLGDWLNWRRGCDRRHWRERWRWSWWYRPRYWRSCLSGRGSGRWRGGRRRRSGRRWRGRRRCRWRPDRGGWLRHGGERCAVARADGR